MRFQQVVRIFATAVGQSRTGTKSGVETKIFYRFGPEELDASPPLREKIRGGKKLFPIVRRGKFRRGSPIP